MASKWVNLTDAEQEMILAELPNTPLAKKVDRIKKGITRRSAKQKGMHFQVVVCEWIAKLIGIPFLRGRDESLISARSSGCNGTDVILRGDAKKRFPFAVEVKCQEKLALVDAVLQSMGNKEEGVDWLIVHRQKALPCDIIIMDKDAFGALLRRANQT